MSVLIVGGGVIGAGLFRELALQGVDVLLVDRGDFSRGTSAAPSRMIHGGWRYLEFGEYRLVTESVNERNRLVKNAPHYVKPLPTVVPIYRRVSGLGSWLRRTLGFGAGKRPPYRGSFLVKLGLSVYDWVGRQTRCMPRHTFTSRAESLAEMPGLNPDILCTATYYDASVSYPERLCMELLFDGEELCADARAVNYLSLDSASGDTIVLRDEVSAETLEVKPRIVVNATGAWIDFTNKRMGLETKMIGGTKGAHLMLENPELCKALGDRMVFYETPDGRVSITMVWQGKAMIGSTDIRCDDPDTAVCDDDEIDYMIDAIKTVFPKIEVDRSQILGSFSGVRPLANKEAATTGQLSRAHKCTVLEPGDGPLSFPVHCMVGGKWTPFRAFASDVTDTLLASLDRERQADSLSLAIGGGKDYPDSEAARQSWVAALAEKSGLPAERVATLLYRYGTRAEQVAEFLVAEDDAPLENHAGYTRREIEFMVRHERVMRLDDILLRRTAIALAGELTAGLLTELADIVAPLLGWTPEQTKEEMEHTSSILAEKHGIAIDK